MRMIASSIVILAGAVLVAGSGIAKATALASDRAFSGGAGGIILILIGLALFILDLISGGIKQEVTDFAVSVKEAAKAKVPAPNAPTPRAPAPKAPAPKPKKAAAKKKKSRS